MAAAPLRPERGGAPAEPIGEGAGIAAAVDVLSRRPARLGATRLVAVDGPSGSGKTSLAAPLAAAIAERLGGRVIRPSRRGDEVPRTDPEGDGERVRAGRGPAAAHRGDPGDSGSHGDGTGGDGSPLIAVVSTDLLATWEEPLGWWPILDEHLLTPLAAGRIATMPVVQWVSGNPRPGGSIAVPPVDVLVLEGVSSGRAAVIDRMSALVWVEVPDAAVRLERAVARDGEGMRPFLVRWQIDEQAHFAADGTRTRADVVIDPTLP